MRIWPKVSKPLPRLISEKPGQQVGTDAGDVIEAFLASGGATFFVLATGFDPQPAGVQLLASVFVPRGKIAFVKQITVAPFMPTELSDPWHAEGVLSVSPNTSWRIFDFGSAEDVALKRPGGQLGVWETPFGWEGYFDTGDRAAFPPQWVWHLRMVPGDISKIQTRPFDTTVPESWMLQPNVAVPASAYNSGIPGATPFQWPGQRMQVLQGDKLVSHVVVPENTTICLFAQWRQRQTTLLARDTAGTVIAYEGAGEGGFTIYPLLPSFGQLHGYMQATDRPSTTHNSRFGWGG